MNQTTKESICLYYLMGSCQNGQICPHQHEKSPVKAHNEDIPCQFYAIGTCKNEGQCEFLHPGTQIYQTKCQFYQAGYCQNGDQCDDLHQKKSEYDQFKPKLEICQFFLSSTCKYGDQCKLAHMKDSIRSEIKKTEICRFFKTGSCTQGHKCEFQHTQKKIKQFQKKDICPFYLTKTCKYGDQCTLSHNQESQNDGSSSNSSDSESDDQESKEFKKNIKSIQNKRIEKQSKNKSVDIVIVMDCTQSMLPFIIAAKQSVNQAINSLQNEFQEIGFRVGFVGYRDFDIVPYSLEVYDLTSDIYAVQNFIAKVQSYGGGDHPQDVAGGLDMALTLNWKIDSYKLVLLIADAPNHGFQYHVEKSDDRYPKFPLGIPSNLMRNTLPNIIEQYAQRRIDLTFFKINQSTDKMIKEFNQVLKANRSGRVQEHIFMGINDQNQTNDQFYNFMNNSAQNSLINEFRNGYSKAPKISHQVVKFNEVLDQFWQNIKGERTFECKYVGVELYPSNFKTGEIDWLQPNFQFHKSTSKISVRWEVFSEGGMRVAMYAYDHDLKQKMVVKMNKQPQANSHQSKDLILRDIEMEKICEVLIKQFNLMLFRNFSSTLEIVFSFVPNFMVQSKDFPYEQNLAAENFIEGNYQKYTNNFNYQGTDERSQLAIAFTHFTWQYSQGKIMVTDLQGSDCCLTDPQIHSIDQTLFGEGNLGPQGMNQFFKIHKCNNYCFQLNLVHPFDKHNLKQGYQNQLDSEIVIPESILKKQIQLPCIFCFKKIQMTVEKYAEICQSDQSQLCQDCESELSKQITQQCQKCSKDFSESEFYRNMKRYAVNIYCFECRKAHFFGQ